MRFVNITPMFLEHKEEICRDLAQLQKNGVITETAFMMKLNPEGTPPVDAVTPCVRQFETMRDELRKYSDMPVGILIQAIIGHGYWLDSPPENFQTMKSMPPENPDNMPHIVCPLDPGFRRYFAETAEKLAALKPDFMLIDDDFRAFSWRNGCFCPLHVAEFNRRTGGNDTPETLAEKVRNNPQTALRYEHFVGETFADALRILRENLDRTAPECNVYYCSCVQEIKYAARFAQVLAAKGKPPVVRINNSRYTTETMRDFPGRMHTTAYAVSLLRADVPEILSEPDTFPHNQYSTSAALLNCHMAGSILEGCNGSKHWITSLKTYEPESGLAYRRILTGYRGFYRVCHELARQKRDAGVVCPLPGENFRDFNIYQGARPDLAPGIIAVFARMGIPVNYTDRAGSLPVILNDTYISSWSDAEIRTFLEHGALLDGPCAKAVFDRGFGALLGVTVESFPPVKTTHETGSDGVVYRPQPDGTLFRLIPASEQTEVLSMLGAAKSQAEENPQPVAPGMTFYRNQAGGAVAIFAGTAEGGPWLSEFSFLNQTRKQAILKILNRINPLPVCYPGTEEIYCKLWEIDGVVHLPFFTLGRDDLSELELSVANTPDAVESLLPSGEWKPLPFRVSGNGRIVVESEFRATHPFVLRFPGIARNVI